MPKKLPIIAGIMLLLAIPSMWPYAYFQILRWVVCIVSGLGAYEAGLKKKNKWVITLILIAILFNPIAPIFLAKGTWVILDAVAAILLFVSVKYV